MSRCRALVVLLALGFALPTAAFAQGAGDEQYQDPFADEQAQNDGRADSRAAQDDDGGLSDEPPIDDGGDDGGNGATTPTPPPEDPGDEEPARDPADEPKALPNTGSDPRILAFVGLFFVMVGVGLRLRTIDPDAY